MTGKKTMGRPSIGETRKISLTLPAQVWAELEQEREKDGMSKSHFIRSVVMMYYKGVHPDDK